MNIAIIGATGFIGRGILSESLARGHKVTAIVRDATKLPFDPSLTARQADVRQTQTVAALVAGHDVVISAYNPGLDGDGKGARAIVEAVKIAGVPRLLVVGGAGSLEVAPGQRLVDQPGFPGEWKEGALRTAEVLGLLRNESELDWVFVSPAAVILPGERTGVFRIGGDQFMTGNDGQSRISLEDYAIAMLNEAETKQHSRETHLRLVLTEGAIMQIRRLGWAGVELRAGSETLVLDYVQDTTPMLPVLRSPEEPFPSAVGSTAVCALLTHMHADHADADALTQALSSDGPVLRPEPATGNAADLELTSYDEQKFARQHLRTTIAIPWQEYQFGEFKASSAPAVDGFGDPQLTWLVECQGQRILHAGDTLFHGFWWRIAHRYGPLNVAFLPINAPVCT